MGFLPANEPEPDMNAIQAIIEHANTLLAMNDGTRGGDEAMRIYTERLSMTERGYVIACLLGEIQRLNKGGEPRH